jgi:aspartate kinase
MTIVAKFGGTSMATGRSFEIVGKRIAKKEDMRVIVISAPGKITDANDPEKACGRDPIKVSDRLLTIARKGRGGEPLEEDIHALENRYRLIEDSLGMGDEERVSPTIKEAVAQRIAAVGRIDEKHTGPVAALGEELNARLFAAYLRRTGVPAAYLDPRDAGFEVRIDNDKAGIDPARYPAIRAMVQKALDKGERIVFPGFFGYDSAGMVRTFARGGSDYTGSVLAAAMDANEYENFTDTEGIRAAEPSIDPDAPMIRAMTHRELTELTLGGAFGVFQYEAAVPLAIKGVATRVLNTFDEDSTGTLILSDSGISIFMARLNWLGDHAAMRDITGLVQRGEFVAFNILRYGMENEVGAFERVIGLFREMGISIEHAPSSTNDISIIVRKKGLADAGVHEGDVLERIRERIRPHRLMPQYLSAVAIVGERLGQSRDTLKRIFSAVSDAGLSVPRPTQQGISLTLWFNNGDAEKAAKAIYRECFDVPKISAEATGT